MRLVSMAAVAVALACAREAPDTTVVPRDDLTLESIRAPRDGSTNQIAGLVKKREGGAVLIDSGGPDPIPLRLDGTTKVTVDDKPGTPASIREGDLVRAAYRFDASGAPLALLVVANSRPVQTERVQAAAEQPAQQGEAQPAAPAEQPSARQGPRPGSRQPLQVAPPRSMQQGK